MELFIVLFILLIGCCVALLANNIKLKSEAILKDYIIGELDEDIKCKDRLINFYQNKKETKDV